MGRIPASHPTGQPGGCSNLLPANLSGGLRRYDPIATLSLITGFVSSLKPRIAGFFYGRYGWGCAAFQVASACRRRRCTSSLIAGPCRPLATTSFTDTSLAIR